MSGNLAIGLSTPLARKNAQPFKPQAPKAGELKFGSESLDILELRTRALAQELPHDTLNGWTRLFRTPFLFRFLPFQIKALFPNGAPIYCFGASDGSDAYSLTIKMVEDLGFSQAAKYPMFAYEYDEERVAQSKSGEIALYQTDFDNAQIAGLKKPLNEYFEMVSGDIPDELSWREGPQTGHGPWQCEPRGVFKPNPQISMLTNYDQGDIRVWAKRPQKRPSVVMFRNAWYELGRTPRERQEASRELAEDLYHNLPSGSLLVVGSTEVNPESIERNGVDVPTILKETGFEKIQIKAKFPFGQQFAGQVIYRKP